MSFLLSPQGHNQGEVMAYNRGDYLLVTTDREQAPQIAQVFDRYIIMDDVEVADISDKLATVGVAGPKAAEVLAGSGIDVAGLEAGEVRDLTWNDTGISVAHSSHPQMDGYEIWFAPANAEQGLERAGSGRCDARRQRRGGDVSHGARAFRVTESICASVTCRRRPARSYALNFSKGCYIGQEIVERIRSRGNVHRTFAWISG